MKSIAAGVAVSLIIGASLTSAALAHDALKRCGRKPGLGYGWAKVRAHGPVSCRTARKVARRWERKLLNGDRGRINLPGIWPGYTCRKEKRASELWHVKCTAKKRIVHFQWGF
jgi:hypothetical protein